MASKKINITIPELPQVEIYLEGDWVKAKNLISGLATSIRLGYDNSVRLISKSIKGIVKRAIKTGRPPGNSGAKWVAHSPNTIRVHGVHPIYNLNGLYARSINIYKYKDRTIVGLPLHTRVPKTKLTLNQLAIILEYGSNVDGRGAIPPRPLWAPAYKSYGGNSQVKKIVIREIRKAIFKGHGLRANQVRLQ